MNCWLVKESSKLLEPYFELNSGDFYDVSVKQDIGALKKRR